MRKNRNIQTPPKIEKNDGSVSEENTNNNSGETSNGSEGNNAGNSGSNNAGSSGGQNEGASLYRSHCQECHGSLEQSAKKGATVERIKSGMQNAAMKPLKSKLNDQDLKSIANALSATDFLAQLIPKNMESYCKGFAGTGEYWNNGIHDPAKIACFDSIDAVFSSVPKLIRSYFNLMVDSESAQTSTPNYPRIIMNTPWGGDGNFVLATSTHPDSGNHLEVIAWDGKQYRWKPLGIDFSTSPPTLENSSCESCHGKPFKAIWGGYLSWPGAIDHNGKLDGNIEDGSILKRDLLKKYMKDDKSLLKHLVFKDSYETGQFTSADPLINNSKMSKVLMMIIISNLIDAYSNKILTDKNLTNNQIFEFIWRSSCRHKWKMGPDLNKLPRVMTQYRSAYLKLDEYAKPNYTDPYERLGASYRWEDNLRVSKINSKGTFEYIRLSNDKGTYIDAHLNNKLLYRMNLLKPALKLAEKLPDLFSIQNGIRNKVFEFWNPEKTLPEWRALQNASKISLDDTFFRSFNKKVLTHFEGEALGKYTQTCNKIKELACEGRNSCLQF